MTHSENKNNQSWLAEQLATPGARRVYEQERLVLAVTNALTEVIEQQNVSRADLARKLDRSRAFVTQILAGTRNMTLHTLADLAWALDCRATLSLCDMKHYGYRPLPVSKPEMEPRPQVAAPRNEGEPEPAMFEGEFAANSELAIAA